MESDLKRKCHDDYLRYCAIASDLREMVEAAGGKDDSTRGPLLLACRALRFSETIRNERSDSEDDESGQGSWRFSPGRCKFRGHEFPLAGTKWRLMKQLSVSRLAQTLDDLKTAVWPDDDQVEDGTVRKHLSELRREIRKHLDLEQQYDPIPRVDRGPLAAWRIAPDLKEKVGLRGQQ